MAARVNRVGWLVTGGACTWVVALALATATSSSTAPGPLAFSATATVYALASLVCHQRPDRSFHILSAQVPVCARCAGLYVGAAIAACLALRRHVPVPASTMSRSEAWTLVVVGGLPTLFTLAVEWTTRTPPSNVWRATAGFPIGAAIAWVLVATGQREHQSK